MTPNLYLATQTLFSPHKWFVRKQSAKPRRQTEHWKNPIAGTYEYIPGRGWYLVATDHPEERLAQPVHVKYSKVLKRYMLQPDYESRKRHGNIKDEKGKTKNVCFFQLDDGIAWVQCWDEQGHFIPGPYKMWCLDKETRQFRHMLKGDDPDYASRSNSRVDDRNVSSRKSQESRSTQYRGEGGSARTPNASEPSTRANSVRGRSAPPTRPGSPRGPSLSQASTLLTPAAVEKRLKSNPPAQDPEPKSTD